MFSAIPPTLAGASLLANDAPTLRRDDGPARRSDTAPAKPGGADVGEHRHRDDQRGPPPVRLLHLLEDPRQIGELWDQEVGRGDDHGHREHRPLVEAFQLG